MKKLYLIYILIGVILSPQRLLSQSCATLTAAFQTYESRCAATGAIKIFATGGSGVYKYKVTGPVNSNFTTSDSITGLSAGIYKVEIADVNLNCSKTFDNITIQGDYADPRFVLTTQSVGCDNGSNGQISVTGLQFGRAPYTFSIVAPSPMGVGTSNSTGVFTGLIAGDYSIRLTDSCGGIQTRTVSIDNYTWRIDSYSFTKFSCDSASGYLKVIDSRGNVSTVTGIPGMKYAIVTAIGDTLWSTDPNFVFYVRGVTSIQALAMDSCGNIKKINTSLFLFPSLGATVNISDKSCNTFTATLTSIKNFFNPTYCIYDQNGDEVDCNNTGQFIGLPYGDYCIKAHDDCTDSTITRCISVKAPVPSVANQVLITNKTCNTFTATITGQTNLTSPTYCIFNSSNVLMGCNTTGVFNNLPYGDYCIATRDGCIDTTITRCFSVPKPLPRIPNVITPSYVNCVNFGLDIDGDSLTLPTFCLTDTLGNIIACNNDGIFDSIPLGSYCVTVHDACLDTTIQRCFNVGPPVVANDMTVSISNKTCTTFTATVNTSNLSGSLYCLYDSTDQLLSCDSSGVFTNLTYAKYCIKAKVSCPDTTVITCFITTPPIPAVDAGVNTNGRTCNTFNANVTGQSNLTNPAYYLVDNKGDTIATNTSGNFTNLAYGDYCILIKDGCYDTTIQRCFTELPPVFDLTASASKSCNYGFSKFNLSLNTYPANIYLYDTSNTLILSSVANGPLVIDNIPELPGHIGVVVAVDACGNRDTVNVTWESAYLNHRTSVKQKCPGSAWANGSGDINATVTTNSGALTVRIISKDGSALSPYLTPNFVVDSVFTFQDLGPGTYVLRYNSNDGCNVYMYDTVIVNPYTYPNLSRSSAYQCDVNGFSVGAVVSNGVGPFTYEIIGSSPSTPSIIAGPQSSPIFNINNGFNYTLVRLRALDACGNATLGDASILPLANYGITVNENCIGVATTLKIDTVYNSTVSWYFKKKPTDTDSTYLGDGFQFTVNPLGYADTGYYYCSVVINNGCIKRVYAFNLNGDCYPVLPILLVELNGYLENNKSYLSWSIRNDAGLKRIWIERKNGDAYQTIGKLEAHEYTAPGLYNFTDEKPERDNYYRLRLEFENGKVVYSKIIYLQGSSSDLIKVFPNPAVREVQIELPDMINAKWSIELRSVSGQKSLVEGQVSGRHYTIQRLPSMASGLYILKVTDLNSGKEYNYRIVFQNQ